jgi:NAD(P)H-hydrate epimerase
MGALRAGAGLVTVATPAAALPLVAAARPELMTEPLPASGDCVGSESLGRALELAEGRDAVVLGPGLGQGREVREFVASLLARCPRPIVLDADGLNAVAAGRSMGALPGFPRAAKSVLTPHPGEAARLLGSSSAQVQEDRHAAARALAALSGGLVVLKGHRTVIAGAEGAAAVNPTGNAGMATGGSGDVLAGIVGALLARRSDPWLAASAAVYVHGRAGDLAAAQRGEEALIAGDLVEALGAAILSVQRGEEASGIARLPAP